MQVGYLADSADSPEALAALDHARRAAAVGRDVTLFVLGRGGGEWSGPVLHWQALCRFAGPVVAGGAAAARVLLGVTRPGPSFVWPACGWGDLPFHDLRAVYQHPRLTTLVTDQSWAHACRRHWGVRAHLAESLF